MPYQPWSAPVQVALSIPLNLRTQLSFDPNTGSYTAVKTLPDPVQVADEPSRTQFEFQIPLYMKSAGDLPVGGWAEATLLPEPRFIEDAGWVPPEDLTGSRYTIGQPAILMNPKLALTDGTPDPWTVQQNRDPQWGWNMPVSGRKLVLDDRMKVTITTQQLVNSAGVAGILVGPGGTEAGWFGNWGGPLGTASFTLNPGVYLLLTGVTNAYNFPDPLGEINGVLTITVAMPLPTPKLITTQSGWFRSGMESTSLVHNWGILYQFDAPVTGEYSFYMSGAFDTFLALSDASGMLLIQNDDYGNASYSRIDQFHLIGGRTYYVSTSAYNQGAQGAYTVGVEYPAAASASVPSVTGWKLTTLAGGVNNAGYIDGPFGTNRLVAPGAAVYNPGDDTVYVLESEGMRKITRNGAISPFIGEASGYDGKSLNGPVASAKLNAYGNDMVLGPDGALYFTDQVPSIRRVKDGVVSTYAGANWTLQSIDGINATKTDLDTGQTSVELQATNQPGGHVDGPRLSARFTDPQGLAFDADGNLWVADDCYLRKITPDGTVSTPYGSSWLPGSAQLNAFHNMDGAGNRACLAETPSTAPTVALGAAVTLHYDPARGEGLVNGVSYAYAFVDEGGVESPLSPWSADTTPVISNPSTGTWTVTPVEVTLPADGTGTLKQVIYAQMTMNGSTKIALYRIVRDHIHALVTDYFCADWLTVLRGASEMATVGDVWAARPTGAARFKRLQGLSAAPNGVLWAVDEGMARIVKIANGVVSTVVETGHVSAPFAFDGQGASSANPPGFNEIPPFHYDDAPSVEDTGGASNGLGLGEFLATVVVVMPDGRETLPAPVTCRMPQAIDTGGGNFTASVQRVWAPFVPSGCLGWRVYYRMTQWGDSQPWLRGPLMEPGISSCDISTPWEDKPDVTKAKTGLPSTCRGNASADPIGCCWDNVRKLLLFTDYNNVLRGYDPHTGWVQVLIGDDWHATRSDNTAGMGDGFLNHAANSPFYIKPGWDTNTFLVDDWYGQTVRVLEYGTWAVPPTTAQSGTPGVITPGQTVEGVFLRGEDYRDYTLALTAGQVVSIKMFYLDAVWSECTLLDPTSAQVSRDGVSHEDVGAAWVTSTETYTAGETGAHTLRLEPMVLNTVPPAPWVATHLSRFKFQVTVT